MTTYVDDGAPHPADMPEHTAPAGRVPPHNLDAEAALLGAMLLSSDAIAAAIPIVRAGDFYKPTNAHIFDAICTLYAKAAPVDYETVAEELDRAGLLDAVGGKGSLVDIESTTPATTNASYYARIIEERSMMRKLIGAGGEVAQLGYDVPDDIDKAVDTAESIIFRIAERRVTDSTTPLYQALDRGLDHIEKMFNNQGAMTGVRTGFDDIDRLTGGLQDGALYLIGARPATGKTALALGIAAGVALTAHMPVLVFSLEMSTDEVTQRLLCAEARVDSRRIRTGQLTDEDWKKVSRAVGRLGEASDRFFIDDNPMVTVTEIRAKARRLRAEYGKFGAIILDYLQLMVPSRQRDSRNLEVAEISRGLKVLARELETPVIALSQLSRGVESRQDKRPTLADLRDSGALEQDADVVAFIYRDALYDREKVDDGDTELIFAKHRNGPTGTVHLTFIPRLARFEQAAKDL